MLDLETLSTRPDAAIAVIGAIKFSRHSDNSLDLDEMDSFYVRVELSSCTEKGLRVDQSTLTWWEKQDPEVRHEALDNPNRMPLEAALLGFSKWFGNAKYVWRMAMILTVLYWLKPILGVVWWPMGILEYQRLQDCF